MPTGRPPSPARLPQEDTGVIQPADGVPARSLPCQFSLDLWKNSSKRLDVDAVSVFSLALVLI